MNESTGTKIALVKESLREMGSVLVAYSGGTDSTLLATLAHREKEVRSSAVLVTGSIFPDEEERSALETARSSGFPIRTVLLDFLEVPEFVANPPDRCYHCRRTMIGTLKKISAEEGLALIIDGNNYDDLYDYRPGRRAAVEGGVRSPFLEAELTKEEIRTVSREMGLLTWNKPASPCLASRIPYGTPVTTELLRRIEAGEKYLRSLGLTQVRLRHHGDIARIEVVPEEMGLLVGGPVRSQLVETFRALGYKYVTLDLAGYRTGSLNEGIEEVKEKNA